MEEWKTWTNEELERQVSPSRWNPSKNGDDVINQHICVSNEETQRARQRISHELNISYGSSGSPSQKYDLYGTDLPDKATILFWIHGGYWQEGSKDISATMAQNLYSIGVKTLVLEYSLAPEGSLYQMKTDFFMALKHAMEKFPESRLVVGGHSAGAQLAAMLLHQKDFDSDALTLKNRIIGFVLISGVYDLRPLVTTYVNHLLKLTIDDATILSPLLQPFHMEGISEDISLLLCIGQYESPEFKRQTMDYMNKLKGIFSNVYHSESEKDDHFTIIERLAQSSESSPGRTLLDFIKSVI